MKGHNNTKSFSTTYIITLENNDIRNSCLCFVPQELLSRLFNGIFGVFHTMISHTLGIISSCIRAVGNCLGIGNTAAKASAIAIGGAL